MMYLSKGILCKGSNSKAIFIRHYGLPVKLIGKEAQVWLDGRLGFSTANTPAAEKTVQLLAERSLVKSTEYHDVDAQYWILTKCLILPARRRLFAIPVLSKQEKTLLIWIRKAGFNLSIAELIWLLENKIKPSAELLYEKNRIALHRLINPFRVGMANQLEQKMLHTICRHSTVRAVLSLLRKKYIIIN